MSKCDKIYEVEGIDARNGNGKFRLTVACNKRDAVNRFSRYMGVNKRFLDIKIKEVNRNKYIKLPKRRGVY